MTMRVAIHVVLAAAAGVAGAACSNEATDAGPSTTGSATADASHSAGVVRARVIPATGSVVSSNRGRACPPGTIDCGNPDVPPHGTVHAPWTCAGAVAMYACSEGYTLVGEPIRKCQADGTWAATAPTCRFAAAGSSCGGCGGTYTEDGTCSRPTPPHLGLPCDVGSGQGACAKGGTVDCAGVCQPIDATVGDPTAWHITPAANGSWDWDCDGVVTPTLVPTAPPPECSAHTDAQSCNDAPTIEYVTESSPCGEQATLFKRDCDWKAIGPTCLDTPDGHRVVFQQCR